MNNKLLKQVGILLAILFFGYKYYYIIFPHGSLSGRSSDVSQIVDELTNAQKSNLKVLIFGPERYLYPQKAFEMFKMYGITSQIIQISDANELLKAIPSLKKQDLQQPNAIPVFMFPDGKIVFSKDIYPALATMKIGDLHPGKTPPYVILYGQPDDPDTIQVRKQLSAMKISYEYVELEPSNLDQEANILGGIVAREAVSGYTMGDHSNTPFLEIDGYVRPREYIQQMIEKLNQQGKITH